ncbi:uncharacterized protein DMENIID0001_032740 [Sergentomyia squamirostris]
MYYRTMDKFEPWQRVFPPPLFTFLCCLFNGLFSFSIADAAKGLRNLTLSIEPAWVRRGQSAQLHCRYEMKGAPLYSVKWYRGNLEFYRYSPFDNPPAKIFPYTGIKVDNPVDGIIDAFCGL